MNSNSTNAIFSTEVLHAMSHSCMAVFTNEIGHVLFANERFCNFLGFQLDELVGRDYMSSTSDDILEFREIMNDSVVHEREVCRKTKEGNPVWIYETIMPIVSPDTQKITSFLFIVVNVTNLKNAEEEGKKFRKQLMQSQKMDGIGKLASGVAHDFNNILMPIIGFTQLSMNAIRNGESQKALDYLVRSERSAKQAANLVSKMLIFSRQRSKQDTRLIKPSKIIEEVLEIGQLLRSGIGTLTPILFDNALNIELSSILIDPSELHQIVVNLIVNAHDAIKASNRTVGKIKITLFGKTLHDNDICCNSCGKALQGEYIAIGVQDNGSGIPEDKINTIFESFFTTKEEGKGTGLGLSVVSEILHEVNAHITVRSAVDIGTTFTLLFPANYTQPFDFEKEQEVIVDLDSNLKILVVDDDEEIRYLLQEGLTDLGYDVKTFCNPLDILECIEQDTCSFDIVIIDYEMPVMTGAELSYKILEKRPNIPIIICTGCNPEFLENQFTQKAARENLFLVQKPIDLRTLNNTIKKMFIGK